MPFRYFLSATIAMLLLPVAVSAATHHYVLGPADAGSPTFGASERTHWQRLIDPETGVLVDDHFNTATVGWHFQFDRVRPQQGDRIVFDLGIDLSLSRQHFPERMPTHWDASMEMIVRVADRSSGLYYPDLVPTWSVIETSTGLEFGGEGALVYDRHNDYITAKVKFSRNFVETSGLTISLIRGQGGWRDGINTLFIYFRAPYIEVHSSNGTTTHYGGAFETTPVVHAPLPPGFALMVGPLIALGLAGFRRHQVLNRKCSTSPSCTT